MQSKRKFSKIALVLLFFILAGIVSLYFGARKYFPLQYQDAVQQMSGETGIPESLIYAVIHTESNFRPEVESHLGARGLMQLTEETYDWVAYRMEETANHYDDLFEPRTNIRYGVWLLALLEKDFPSNKTTLAAYHAGWGNVKKWLTNPEYSQDGLTLTKTPFRDTSHYIYKVERAQKIYRFLYWIV